MLSTCAHNLTEMRPESVAGGTQRVERAHAGLPLWQAAAATASNTKGCQLFVLMID